jgi:hypothetical protein
MISGVIDARPATVSRPASTGAHGLASAQPSISTVLHEMPSMAPFDPGLLIQAADPQYTRLDGGAQSDWSITSAFQDDTTLRRKDAFTVVVDSAEISGIALSVGVVWWASRISGVIGSLLASMPAWRQLDPLPVVASDGGEPSYEWDDTYDRQSNADEVAVSRVLLISDIAQPAE